MDKYTEECINNIVRLIPIRKIRDSVRQLLFCHFSAIETQAYLKALPDIEKLITFSISNKDDELIIKRVSGGLSDQISHYCYGRYIELKYNRKVKYDVSCYGENTHKVRNSNRNFELLNLFPNLNLDIAEDFNILVYKRIYNIEDYKGTLEECLRSMKQLYIYYEGVNIYCDAINFNKQILETIKKELDFDKYVYPLLRDKNLDYYNEIKSSDISIGIHVRRGDYIVHAQHLDENYFINAIELISTKVDIKKAKLFFFSDSMEWVSENIIPKIKNKYNYVLVDENDDTMGYIDLYLLMSTQHQIASVGNFCCKAHSFNNYKDKLFIVPSENMEPKIREDYLNVARLYRKLD